jgi:transglutaminase-like putative cysteine protease
MRCEIRHTTEYHYPRPAWNSFNQVRLHPSSETRQSVRLFHLNVTPDAEITSHKDYFGAIVHHVHVHEHHRHLIIEAQAIVDTHAVTLPTRIPFSELRPERGRNTEFLVSSPRVPGGQWPELFGVARPGPGDDLPGFLLDLTGHLRRRFTYDPSATDVRTPLAEFARTGHGVCQDLNAASRQRRSGPPGTDRPARPPPRNWQCLPAPAWQSQAPVHAGSCCSARPGSRSRS